MFWAVIQIMDAVAAAGGSIGIDPAGIAAPSETYVASILRFAIMGALLYASMQIATKLSDTSGGDLFGMNIGSMLKGIGGLGAYGRLGAESFIQNRAGRRAERAHDYHVAQGSRTDIAEAERLAHSNSAQKAASRMNSGLSKFQFKDIAAKLKGNGKMPAMFDAKKVALGYQGRKKADAEHHEAENKTANEVGKAVESAIVDKLKRAKGADIDQQANAEAFWNAKLEERKNAVLNDKNNGETKTYREASSAIETATTRKADAEAVRKQKVEEFESKKGSGETELLQELQRTIAKQDKTIEDVTAEIATHSQIRDREAARILDRATVTDADTKEVIGLLTAINKSGQRLETVSYTHLTLPTM
jgi:hypothetical protein